MQIVAQRTAGLVRVVVVFGICAILTTQIRADPKADVTDAVQRLSEAQNYSWEVRYAHFCPDRTPGVLRLSSVKASPTLQVLGVHESGITERDGLSVIKVHGSAERVLGGPIIVVSRGARSRIAETPRGWLTDIEIRSAMGEVDGEMVEINGRQVPLHSVLFEAGKALRAIRPDLQLPLLIQDIESFSLVGRYIVGELSEQGKSRRSGRYPSSDQPVTVVFQITHGQLGAYFVSSRKSIVTDSMTGIAIVIKDVGSTSVAAPQGAFDILMR